MELVFTALAALSLVIWIYLLAFRGGFWRASERLPAVTDKQRDWPDVVAVVPARNEATVIDRSISALLAQDYPGHFAVVLVDDMSNDGTATIAIKAGAIKAAAIEAAEKSGQPSKLTVMSAQALPSGWSGKLWALHQGLQRAKTLTPDARYVWLSDADIAHEPGNLKALVAKAEDDKLNLVSLMAKLSCDGFWERLLIPPFIYFFAKLYPFPWANDPGKNTAAAAGGCVLLRRAALEQAGGIESIRGALIDDCTLARRIKDLGQIEDNGVEGCNGIWLGLTATVHSIRPYQGLGDIWTMVARTAYTQLNHSPLLLTGTVLGMVLTYLAPPLLAITAPWHGVTTAGLLALAAWLIMAGTLWPTLRFYRQPAWLAPLLPIAATLYGAMTIDSALRHWRGQGGQWKGRVQAQPAKNH